MPDNAQLKMDAYLGKLRQGLHGINDANAREILEELRSHIIEKASATGGLTEASVEAALTSLGPPGTLAEEYNTDDLLERTHSSSSPIRILHVLFRLASLSVAGFLVLLGTLIGYSFGILCVLCALLKLVHPHTAGVWSIPEVTGDTEISVRLGFGPVPQNGHEVLGWWIVPIGLGLGFFCLLLATTFARWCLRQFRSSRPLTRLS